MANISEIITNLGGKPKLEKALKNNMDWIVKSFKVNDHKGSSGTRSIRGTWGAVYPETTGYLVPTLLAYANYFNDSKVRKLALKQYSYFKSIQNKDGSFRQAEDNKEPIVFDTAQIILGLLAIVAEQEKPEPLLKMIRSAVDWLGLQLNDEGEFTSYNYVKNYNPAYYARVAWPMASAELIKYSKPRTKTKKLISRITDLQLENRSFDKMGFQKNQSAFTHNMAYTFRGLWECAEILNDRKLKKKVRHSMNALNEQILNKGKVAGTYSAKWKADYSFICSTGNAQLALMNLILYERSGHKRNLETVELLLKPLLKSQRNHLVNAGAVPSSIPIRGKYQRMKYTNWTQKFYCDALLKLLQLI